MRAGRRGPEVERVHDALIVDAEEAAGRPLLCDRGRVRGADVAHVDEGAVVVEQLVAVEQLAQQHRGRLGVRLGEARPERDARVDGRERQPRGAPAPDLVGAGAEYVDVFYTFGVEGLKDENYNPYEPDYRRGTPDWSNGFDLYEDDARTGFHAFCNAFAIS